MAPRRAKITATSRVRKQRSPENRLVRLPGHQDHIGLEEGQLTGGGGKEEPNNFFRPGRHWPVLLGALPRLRFRGRGPLSAESLYKAESGPLGLQGILEYLGQGFEMSFVIG